MTLLNTHVAAIAARMMTWEVTTAFDGTLTETELRKRFDDDFCGAFKEGCDERDSFNQVFFWPLISFNATDGRKHRYLLATADETLAGYRKKFDRCLPRQVALYAMADQVLRGENTEKNAPEDGDLLFVALWNNVLYVLVFVKGRLCHWSEDFGYGESIDERCRLRVERFKSFLKSDDLFANSGASSSVFPVAFSEVYVCCDHLTNMDEFFRDGVRDPFWRHLDLDACESMKPCEKRRWTLCFALFALCTVLALTCGSSWTWNRSLEWLRSWNGDALGTSNVAPVELSLPAAHDLEMLAWAKGHRDLLPAKWGRLRDGTADEPRGRLQHSRCSCDSSAVKLLGIVGGRAALVTTAAGEMKTLSLGDSLYSYRVKRIGMDDIVLRCGGKEVRYAVQAR